jgi:hypothetical protein
MVWTLGKSCGGNHRCVAPCEISNLACFFAHSVPAEEPLQLRAAAFHALAETVEEIADSAEGFPGTGVFA